MQSTSWSLRIIRALFVAAAIGMGAMLGQSYGWKTWQSTVLGATVGGLLVLLEISMGRLSFRKLSHSLVGLLVGMAGAALLVRLSVVTLFKTDWFGLDQTVGLAQAQNHVEMIIYIVLGFFGVALALRSDREEFALLIPYVRFKRDASEGEPLLLDTNIVIDGRIGALARTGFLTGSLVVPRLVLDELQRLADSKDPLKEARGKRGLAMLQELRSARDVDLIIHEDGLPDDQPVDTRLVTVARSLNARLLTNDGPLTQVASLRGTTVLSLQSLVKALQQEVQVGDVLDLVLSKQGKDKGQAVGYLQDGAMVVVNQAATWIGKEVQVRVVGITQTHAGRLVFAELSADS
jgi:uncharacterized protein YacL